MLVFFSAVHVLLCIFMIFVILLQPGKDAGMGSALGGGAASSAFGGRGAVTFLGKVTAFCAIGFFATSLGLSFVGLRPSVADDVVVPATTTPLPTGATGTAAPTAPPAAPAPAPAPTDAPATGEAPKP
jgi:preprotein translocase subunit SecG